MASRPLSRSTSRAVFVAFASTSRCLDCAVDEACACDVHFALGRRHAALGAVDSALGGGDIARCLRRHDRNIAGRGDGGRLRVGDVRLGLVQRHLIVARIDLDEHGTLIDLLIVDDQDPYDAPADTRGNGCHVCVHLGVVGRFTAGRNPEPGGDADHGKNDDADANADARSAREGNSGFGCDLIGHQRVPPRY